MVLQSRRSSGIKRGAGFFAASALAFGIFMLGNSFAYIEEYDIVFNEETGEYVHPEFEDDWCLICVDKDHPVPEDYEPELVNIAGNVKCDARVVDSVTRLLEDANNDGVRLVVCSPYRDFDRQTMLFRRKVKSLMKQGLDEEEAYNRAAMTVAVPGTSEHQLGLAFDFFSKDHTTLDQDFADTEAGKWLEANCARYGFILRYPADKTGITGIEYEPWHFRYVGERAAGEITADGLCLEEYLERIGYVSGITDR